jgi:hypothetical protein
VVSVVEYSSGERAPPTTSWPRSSSSPIKTTRGCSSDGQCSLNHVARFQRASCGRPAARGNGASGPSPEQVTSCSPTQGHSRTEQCRDMFLDSATLHDLEVFSTCCGHAAGRSEEPRADGRESPRAQERNLWQVPCPAGRPLNPRTVFLCVLSGPLRSIVRFVPFWPPV